MFQGQKWYQEQFLKFAPAEWLLLLLFDGLKAHLTIDLIEAAKESEIFLYCLPAHSSHLLQPLDLSVFGPLKAGWKRVANTFNHFTGRVINQYNFAHLFKLVWNCSIDFNVIRGSKFKHSSIYPFSRNALTPAKHTLLSSNSLVEKTPIYCSFQAPPANSMPLADILADLLDICIMPQQKIQELKWQPQLKSVNQCLNNQFLHEIREDTRWKKEKEEEKMLKKEEWEAKKLKKKKKKKI